MVEEDCSHGFPKEAKGLGGTAVALGIRDLISHSAWFSEVGIVIFTVRN